MKIKWVKNSRVKRNPKILEEDILEKESDVKGDEISVSMTNITKKHPIINIHFPQNQETKENKIQNHDSGEWITKSWRVTEAIVATINTQENYIGFNRTRFTPEQLNEIMEAINRVKELA
jgi:hypothetical protein